MASPDFPLTEHFDNFTSLPDPKVLFLLSNFPIIRIVFSNSEMQKISFHFSIRIDDRYMTDPN